MFKKFSTLLFALPIISALQLNPPTVQVYSSSPLTVNWTTSSGDPGTFDLYLVNDIFRNTFALKNTITTSDGTVTVALPVVPAGSGYTLQASPTGNVNDVLSQTSSFDISDPISSSSSLSSSTSGTGSLSSVTGSTPSLSTSISRTSTPGSSSSTLNSPATTATGAFNGGNNGALGMTGIGATIVGVLIAAGAFLGL